MTAIVARFTNNAVPLTSPGNAPTIRIRRTDTGALVVTDAAMTELGDGNFRYDFSPTDGLEYAIRADGDPTAAGQVTASERYQWGAFSGTEVARLETDIPAILADTAAMEPFVSANLDVAVSTRNSVVPLAAATDQAEHDSTQAAIAALNDPDAAAIADAVWDEARAGHTGVGTFGENTGDAPMRGTDGANTTVPLAAATDQAEHDSTQAAIAALNDPSAAAVADAVLDEALVDHTTSGSLGDGVARLFGGNTRTKLYFAAAEISTGGRFVPINAVSHMEVSVRPEGGAFPGAVYFVLFNYDPGDTSTSAPRASTIVSSAPVDGSFTSVSYPS